MAFWSSLLTAPACIGRLRRCFNRSFVGVCALGLTLALASCGSDEEKADTATTSPPTTRADTGQEQVDTRQDETAIDSTELPPPETAPETETTPSPEEAPGGAGDEEPARSLALFTGEGGRIRPRVVRVPAFISIRVELRSADGREYGLRFAGETIRVREGLGSVSTEIDGLRRGETIVGEPVGEGTSVRIEATAEPGP